MHEGISDVPQTPQDESGEPESSDEKFPRGVTILSEKRILEGIHVAQDAARTHKAIFGLMALRLGVRKVDILESLYQLAIPDRNYLLSNIQDSERIFGVYAEFREVLDLFRKSKNPYYTDQIQAHLKIMRQKISKYLTSIDAGPDMFGFAYGGRGRRALK